MAANGQLATSALGYVSGHRVRADLVAQTAAMIAAAARDGVTLRITQGYRTLAEQVSIFLARYSPRLTGAGPYGDVRWWNGTRYVRTSGAAAAVPGTSNHGLGQAIDFATAAAAIAWLTRRGREFGWSRPAWTFRAPTIEPWHWEAIPVFVNNPIEPVLPPVPIVPDPPPDLGTLTPLQEDDDMALIISNGKYGRALLSGSRLVGLGNVDGFVAANVPVVPVADADFLRLLHGSTSTWVLFNPPELGGRGYAVWSGGRGVGIGDGTLVEQMLNKGASLLTVAAADFDRFMAS